MTSYAPPAVSTKSFSAVSLGTAVADNTYYAFEVPAVAQRALVCEFTVTASTAGIYDLEVRGDGTDAATLYLQAIGITSAAYAISFPWRYVAAAGTSLWVRIRNRGTASATFTLTSMTIERLA